MRKNYLIYLIFSCLTIALTHSLSAQVTTIDFETADSGYSLSVDATGSGTVDLFNRTSSSGFGGNSTFFLGYEDFNGSSPSTLTLDQITVTGSTSFNISMDLLTPNTEDWDTTDRVVVSYSIDGGGFVEWFAIESIPDGDNFNAPAAIDLGLDDDGDTGLELPAITDGASTGVRNTFKRFTIPSVALSSNTTLDIKFDFYAMTSADEGIYIDNIVVTEDALTWDGSTDNDWATAANWTPASTPSSSSNVFIPTHNITNYPTAAAAVTINTADIESGASLIAQSTFSGTVTYNRTIGTTNWYLISSPIVGQDIDAFASAEGLGSGTDDNRGLGDYNNSTPAWEYYQAGASGTGDFTSGDGRSILLAASGEVAFTGTIDVADAGVDISITSNTNGFNLIGNPYPSYIPANLNADGTNNILTINSASLSENTIWFWDQSTSSYDQINQASASMFIAPAQGFFVSSSGSNTFNFEENMQSHQGTDTFQRTTTRPEINLVMTDGMDVRDADIFYIDGTTTGFDNGYDSSIFGGASNEFAIYTHAVANGTGKNLGIQSLPDNDFENMVIPVGINASSGTDITISAAILNLPAGINVYLEDKDDNTFTVLDGSSDFTTTLSSDLNGIGRFYLHTSSQVLSTDEVSLNNISIYTSTENNLRIVGVQEGTAQIKIYNILGKQVLNTSFQGNGVNDIILPNVRSGVYIIQLETQTGKLNKKIIIE